MPSLDLALGLVVIWGTADMIHFLIFHPIRQFTRCVTGEVVTEQPRLAQNRRLSQLLYILHGPCLLDEMKGELFAVPFRNGFSATRSSSQLCLKREHSSKPQKRNRQKPGSKQRNDCKLR